MHDDLPIDESHVIPAAELIFTTSRASGPGGQHVNTTDTRVQVRWDVGKSSALTPAERERVLARLASRLTVDGILVLASDRQRSQRRNRDDVLARLSALLRQALERPRPRRPTTIPTGAREERLHRKRARAALKRQRRGDGDDT